MLKGKFERQYVSKNKNLTFVYSVTGSDEELNAFEEAQGDFYAFDEELQKPIWFTVKNYTQTCDLIITSKGNVIADTSKFDQAASLAEQYGGNLGQELARASAQQLLGFSAPPQAPAETEDPS